MVKRGRSKEMVEELTIADASREFGVSRQRVLQIAQEGRLGRQVAGRYWIFTRAEIDAFKPRIQGKPGHPRKVKQPANETPAGPL